MYVDLIDVIKNNMMECRVKEWIRVIFLISELCAYESRLINIQQSVTHQIAIDNFRAIYELSRPV